MSENSKINSEKQVKYMKPFKKNHNSYLVK